MTTYQSPPTAPTAATPLPYAAPPPTPPSRLPAPLRALWENAGMVVVFVLMFVAASIFVDHFFTWKNQKGLVLSVATIGMVACTMLFCLAAGDFDLSVGSVLAMAGVVAVVAANATQSALVGIAAGVASGAVIGFVNGFVIAQLGINALITTLATMQIARGLAYTFAPTSVGIGRDIPLPVLGQWADPVLGVSSPIWLLILAFVVFGILLRYTTFGRNTLAIGGNAEAARLAGIRVRRTKIIIFTLQGAMAAFAGVILAARLTSAQPNNGIGLELQVISACVLGGVSLTGGIGTMVGVVVGVLIMGMVDNVMRLMNVPTFYQYIASGTILLIAVLIDRARTRKSV